MSENTEKTQNPGAPASKDSFLVTVNGRPVTLPKGEVSGREIKEAAIEQGVAILMDFVLQQEMPNGNTRIIGDNDDVRVHPHDKFTAIAHDDNS